MTAAVAIRLRPWRVDDAQPVWEAVRESLPQMQPWVPWCHPGYSIDESRAWLETQVRAFAAGTAYEFAIMSSSGACLGGCGLNQIDAGHRRANLGYWVRSLATGRGAATAAVQQLRDWAFTHTPLVRLEIVIASDNVASHRVAVKVGAWREGTMRKRLQLHGVAHDATMFSLLRPDDDADAATRSGVSR